MRLYQLALCAALAPCLAASAATITSYSSQSAFAAASSTTLIENFPGQINVLTGTSYTYQGISFTTTAPSQFGVNNDVSGYHNSTTASNARYLGVLSIYGASTSETLTFSAASAIGFYLGDYYGAETITVLIGGNTYSTNVSGAGSEAFVGFTSTGTFNTVTLSGNNSEIDLVQAYLGTATPAAAAVTPEPSSFALLGTGLLGIAGMVRKRFVR